MIYPIVVYGAPVLRKETQPLTPEYPELDKLIEDMFQTMYSAQGVGLAAPQIGKSLRLFVVDASPWSDEEPALEGFRRAFINPEIYERFGDEELFNEGCLSLPGIHEDVLRHVSIRMRYLDEKFAQHDEVFSGHAARVIQHEYDHLEGKVFTDRLSPLRRSLLRGKLAGLEKGKYKASYKTKH